MNHTSAFLAASLLSVVIPPLSTAQITAHSLRNGLLVLVSHEPAAQDLAVTGAFFAGYRDGPLLGLAHLMEHLAMRETKSGVRLAARYGPLGLTGGAITSGDHTQFFMAAPRASRATLDTILSLHRLRMTELAIEDSAIAAERRRIHTEVDGHLVDPWARPLFGEHRLGRQDTHADLDRITRADLLAFYARYYGPANAALVIRSSLPDSLVLALVSARFESIPPGPELRRPVFRDSTTIRAGRWSGDDGRGRGTLAFAVPGIQHEAFEQLFRAVAVIQTRFRSAGSPVELRLSEEGPASTLVIRASGSGRGRDLTAALQAIRDLLQAGEIPAATGFSSEDLIGCEAAGSWRYCLSDSVARARGSNALTEGSDAQLWPSPVRPPPARARVAVAERGPAPSPWKTPSDAPVRWTAGPSGMEWFVRQGGQADTVHFLVVLAPSDSDLTAVRIAQVELLARAWPKLRNPSGQSIDSLLSARGLSISVRSLPYPTMATADRFLMVGTAPSPIGLVGLEIGMAAPRNQAPEALGLLTRALATAQLDWSSYASLHSEQVQLLMDNVRASYAVAHPLTRQRIASWLGTDRPRYAPGLPEAQLETMQSVTSPDVIRIARDLVRDGRARLAILGTDSASAEAWVRSSGLGRLRRLSWASPASGCAAADSSTKVGRAVAPTTPRPQTTLWAYRCLTPAHSPGVLALANAVIGGFEDALLARRLRTELGVAYAFSSRLIPVWESNVVLWQLEIGTPLAQIDNTIMEIRVTLQGAADHLSSELLENARRTILTSVGNRALDPKAWLRTVLWGSRTPEQDAQAYSGVTLEEVRQALRVYWNGDQVAVVRGG